jgi:hypothetical protein
VPFRVLVDDEPPGDADGFDVHGEGRGRRSDGVVADWSAAPSAALLPFRDALMQRAATRL